MDVSQLHVCLPAKLVHSYPTFCNSVYCSRHEIKRCLLLGRKAMTSLDSILKTRGITLPTKVRLVKSMVFPVVMYGCESWTENWRMDYFELWYWRRLLRVPWTARRSNQSWRKSILNIHWKDWCWSWNSNTLAIWGEELTHWKRPWCWERLKLGGEGDNRGWDGWMASLTWWTWILSKLQELVMDREDMGSKSQTQLRPELSPPGSSVYRILPGKKTKIGYHALFQGILLTQGSNPGLFMSPALAGRFFTTSATWKAHIIIYITVFWFPGILDYILSWLTKLPYKQILLDVNLLVNFVLFPGNEFWKQKHWVRYTNIVELLSCKVTYSQVPRAGQGHLRDSFQPSPAGKLSQVWRWKGQELLSQSGHRCTLERASMMKTLLNRNYCLLYVTRLWCNLF